MTGDIRVTSFKKNERVNESEHISISTAMQIRVYESYNCTVAIKQQVSKVQQHRGN